MQTLDRGTTTTNLEDDILCTIKEHHGSVGIDVIFNTFRSHGPVSRLSNALTELINSNRVELTDDRTLRLTGQ